MKKRSSILLMFLCVFVCPPYGWATDITDHFYSNATLTLAGSPYVVKQVTAVVEGATVTIEPGVEVQLDPGTSLSVSGSMIAQGTTANMIIFKSSAANPAPGAWEQIYIASSSSVFDYVDIRDSKFGIYQNLATNNITNSHFQNNVYGMTFANGGTPTVSNNTIENNVHGLLILGGVSGGTEYQARPVVNNNQFSGQLGLNVHLVNTTGHNLTHLTINAENNNWGTTSLAEIQTKIYDGFDDGASPVVDFNSSPVLGPVGNKNVNEGVLLSFGLSATDASWDTLTLSATGLPTGANLVDTGNGAGTFTLTPTYSQSGNYNVTFTVTDFTGETDQETIVITVADNTFSTSVSYEYDDLNRLGQVIRTDVNTVYDLDEVGNINGKENY